MMKIKKMIIFMYVYIYRCHFGTQFVDVMDLRQQKQNRTGYKQRQRKAKEQGERDYSDLIRERNDEVKYETQNAIIELKDHRMKENKLRATICSLIAEAPSESKKEELKEDLRAESQALREREEECMRLIEKVRVLVGQKRTNIQVSYPECPVCYGPAKFVRGCGHMFCESCCDRSTCAVCREENKVSERSLIF
jgi:hypothetical protein